MDALCEQGEEGKLLFPGAYSSGYLCPLVVFGCRQLFFLPISVTDALGIFPVTSILLLPLAADLLKVLAIFQPAWSFIRAL